MASNKNLNKSKVVKKAPPKKKKKKNCCCSFLIFTLIVSLVILVAGCGAGYYFANQFTTSNFGLTIGETITAYLDIRNVDEDLIELNSYDNDDEADYLSLESKIKRQLYLKDTVEIDYSALYSLLIETDSSDDDTSETMSLTSAEIAANKAFKSSLVMSSISDYVTLSSDAVEESQDDALTNFIVDLLQKDNIDMERLEAFPDDYDATLVLTDVEIASFANKIIYDCVELIDDGAELIGGTNITMTSLLNNLQLGEIALSENASGTPTLRATAVITTGDVVDSVVASYLGEEWYAGVAATLVNLILPQKLYVSIDITLEDDPEVGVVLNNLSDEKMDNIFAIVDGIMGLTGQGSNYVQTQFDTIGDEIAPYMSTFVESGTFDGAVDGEIEIDVLGIAIDSLGYSDDLESEDVIKTMKYVLTSSVEINETSTYSNQYYNSAGEIVYATGDDVLPNYVAVDYVNELLDELCATFGLVSGEDGVSIDDLMGLLGIGESDVSSMEDLLDFIDSNAIVDLAQEAYDNEYEQDPLVITERMLGSVFNDYLDDIMGEDSGFSDYNMTISHLKFDSVTSENNVVHDVIEAQIIIDISSFFDGDDVMMQVIGGLLQEEVSATVRIDITTQAKLVITTDGEILEEADAAIASELIYNNLTADETDFLLDIIETFVPDLAISDLLSEIEEPFREAIDSMCDAFPTVDFYANADGSSNITMSGLFEIVATLIETDDGEEISDEKVINTIVYLCNSIVAISENSTYQNQYDDGDGGTYYSEFEVTDEEGNVIDPINYEDEFMDELKAKFALSDDTTFDDIKEMFGISTSSDDDDDEDEEDKDFIEYIDSDKILELAAQDDDGLELSDRMLGQLFNEFLDDSLGEDSDFASYDPTISHISFDNVYSESGVKHSFIEAAIIINISSAFDDSDDDVMMGLIKDIIDDEAMITVKVDITSETSLIAQSNDEGLSETEDYLESSLLYNDLTVEETDELLDMIEIFVDSLSKDSLLEEIEEPFRDAVSSMTDALPGVDFIGATEYDYTTYMTTSSLFEIVADTLNEEATDEDDEITSGELKTIIVGLGESSDEDYEDELIDNAASDNYDGFTEDLKSKYYIADPEGDVDTFDDVMNLVSADDFDYGNFNVNGDTEGYNVASDFDEVAYKQSSMIYDTRTSEELMPFFVDNEFGAMLIEKIQGGSVTLDEDYTDIQQVSIVPKGSSTTQGDYTVYEETYLEIVMKVSTDTMLGEDSDSTYNNLIPTDEIFITLTLDISDDGTKEYNNDDGELKTYYDVSISINDMEDDDPYSGYDYMFKLLRLMNGGEDPIDLDSLTKEVGEMVYEEFSTIEDSTGGGISYAIYDDGDTTENGMLFTSFYEFLANTSDNDAEADVLQSAIQGLFVQDIEVMNDNNYDIDEIIENPINEGFDINDEDAIEWKIEMTYDATGVSVTTSTTLYDVDFGGLLHGDDLIATDNPFNSSSQELVQFASAKEDGENAILTMTLKLKIDKGDVTASGMEGLMPDEIYFTFYVEVTDDDMELVEVDGRSFVINQLESDEQDAIIDILGYSTDTIEGIIGEVLESVGDIEGATYGDGEVGYSKTTLFS